MKFDGYRIGCAIEERQGHALEPTWQGLDRTASPRWPTRRAEADGPGARCSTARSRPCCPTGGRASRRCRTRSPRPPAELVYFVFDLLHLDGEDLARAAAPRAQGGARAARRARRRASIRYSAARRGRRRGVLREACRLGLEGIVSKRARPALQPGPERDLAEDEVRAPAGARRSAASPIRRARARRDRRAARRLPRRRRAALRREGRDRVHERDARALRAAPRRGSRGRSARSRRAPRAWLGRNAHWVRPELVCEVAFTEWTQDGQDPAPVVPGAPGGQAARGRGPGAAGGRRGARRGRGGEDRDRDGASGRSSRA